MKMLSKAALVATTGAMLVTAMPADARPNRRHHDGIDAGDVIAGALIIGGIAAVASAASSSSRDRYSDRYRDRNRDWGNVRDDDRDGYYNNGYSSRSAVEQCVQAARSEANRYGGWARVTDVTRIDRVRGGYEIRGRLVVEDRGDRNRNWSNCWDRNDRYGSRYDRYGDGYDKGRFSCVTRSGRVADVNLSGLRG
jgi:hypothetical protein